MFSGLMAISSVGVALAFIKQGMDHMAGLPQPAQVAAIAEILDGVPADQQDRVLASVQSQQMSVQVVATADILANLEPLWPVESPDQTAYQSALGLREFSAHKVPEKLFEDGLFDFLTAAEFRVQLLDDNVLVMTVNSAAWVSRFGVPVGFPTAIAGIVVSFMALILLNRQFRPILRLARAVDQLDPANPDQRLPSISAGTDEVRRLIVAFARQQDRVTQLLRARTALIGGVQHDVRTFATRLRLRTERLADPKDRMQAERDINDLVALMDSALLATQTDAGVYDLELIDLATVVEAEAFDRRSYGASVEVQIDPNARGVDILCDRIALRRIIENLLDNGLRYGDEVVISVGYMDGWLSTIFTDNGPGIPEDQRHAMLEPFARMDPSRSRETGGAGLGLSIVASLVAQFDGTLSIDEASGGGARVTFCLPSFEQGS